MTQRERVIKRLMERGEISRNECLRVYISRLGAIICDLTKEGWEFETENRRGDYVYKRIKAPYQKIVYRTEDGREIQSIEKI